MDRWLGDRLKAGRIAKNWTQQELAEKVGVSVRTLQRIEGGEGKKHDTYTIRRIAKEVGVNLDETQQARPEEIASDPSVSTEAPRSIEPPHPERKWLIISLSIIAIAVLLISGITFWALVGKDMYNTVSGQVTCPDNQPVVGVYVYPVNGSGNFATLLFLNSSESVAKFKYILPNGGAYNLHAGCGGTSAKWGKAYRTESCSGTIDDRDFHAFICYEQPPADRSKACMVRYGR